MSEPRLAETIPAIPSCALRGEDREAQRDRWRVVGHSVERSERAEDQLALELTPGYDRELLDETLTVERACCPFFRFDLDATTHRLTVSVDDPGQRPALDALAYALGISGAVLS